MLEAIAINRTSPGSQNYQKDSLTQESIVRKLVLFNTSLKQDFGIVRPRIAVLALNPHAGEAGLLGREEETIIIPAINEAEKEGVMSFGPYAADGFFGSKLCRSEERRVGKECRSRWSPYH